VLRSHSPGATNRPRGEQMLRISAHPRGSEAPRFGAYSSSKVLGRLSIRAARKLCGSHVHCSPLALLYPRHTGSQRGIEHLRDSTTAQGDNYQWIQFLVTIRELLSRGRGHKFNPCTAHQNLKPHQPVTHVSRRIENPLRRRIGANSICPIRPHPLYQEKQLRGSLALHCASVTRHMEGFLCN
jgi:hypothetical protein